MRLPPTLDLPGAFATLAYRIAYRLAYPIGHDLHGLGANFAQIYFVPSAALGTLLLALLALAAPAAATTGLAASTIATLLALALRLPNTERRSGIFGYNGALTGIAIGTLWQITPQLWLWLAICVALTVLASVMLARLQLPALTGPFVAVMSLTLTLQPSLGLITREPAIACMTDNPGFVFCGIGQVVFVAPLVLGLLTCYLLALWNARATAWALGAGLLNWGMIATLGTHWPALAGQAGGIGVNGFLAALGLGMFERAIGTRLVGAAAAAVICLALGHLDWPYFTLPFNLAVWSTLALSKRKSPGLKVPGNLAQR